MGEVLLSPGHLGGYVVCAALAPGMTGEGLGPEAEGALGGAAAGAVEGDEGVKEEGDVVPGDVHVAGVDFGGPGHGVQIFDLGAVGVVLDDAVGILVGDAEDLWEGLAVGILDDGEVELAAADEVDYIAFVESAVGVGGDRGADEGDADGGIGLLDGLGEAVVAVPAYGGGEEDEELVVFGDFDGLGGGDVVGRGVKEAGAFEHACGIGEPDGIPIRLDLAGGWPAGACAPIKVLEGGRVEQKRL